MADLFLRLSRHVKDMSKRELESYFPEGTEKSYLMRSIIMSEKEHGRVTYNRSLRSLWYSTVKPTLDKLGLLTEDDQTEEGLTKWDAVLSRYVADLLRRGYLTYQSLSILDNSRQRANPANYYDVEDVSIYGSQVTIAPYSNIIIATEKDTVYNIIRNIAKLFGCSCISSKGQNSLGAMEDLVRGMRGNFDEIYILTMTDYDPAGYYIADALKKQVEDLTVALDKPFVRVHIKRIGITPKQLSPQMVEANKYTPKPANLEKWLELTGGINGQPKGLELDALEPEQIREIFVKNIREFIKPDIYKEFVKKSYIKKIALKAMASKIDDILNSIIDEVEDDVKIKRFDITELAKQGYGSLPISSLCHDNQDKKIAKKALEHFAI
jgi:hypothetical protein